MKVGDLVRDISHGDIGIIIYCSDDDCNDIENDENPLYEVVFPDETAMVHDTYLELVE